MYFSEKSAETVPFAGAFQLQALIQSHRCIMPLKRRIGPELKRFIYEKALFIVFDTL
jgi:hypothetical protein